MFRRIGVVTVAALMLVSMASPALALEEPEADWTVDEDRVEVRQSSAAGTVIVVDLPAGAVSGTQATDGVVPVPSKAEGLEDDADELLVTVEPNQLCRDAAGLVGEHWDVDAVLGQGGPSVPALPEIDPDDREIVIDPAEAEQVHALVEEALAELEAVDQGNEDPAGDLEPGEQLPEEAQAWLDATEKQLEMTDEKLVSLIEAGREISHLTPLKDLQVADQLLDKAIEVIEDDHDAEALLGELDATIEQAIEEVSGEGSPPVEVTIGPDTLEGALNKLTEPLPEEGSSTLDTVEQALESAEEEGEEAGEDPGEGGEEPGDDEEGEEDGVEQHLAEAEALAEDALTIVEIVEAELEEQTSGPLFQKAEETAPPATSALEDLVASLEDAQEDPDQGAIDEAKAHLSLAEDQVQSLLEDVDAGSTAPPGQIRVFLPMEDPDPDPGNVEDTDPDDLDDGEDPLEDVDEDPDAPEDTDGIDDAPDAGDPSSVCRQGAPGQPSDDTGDDGDDGDGSDDADDGTDGTDGSEGSDGSGEEGTDDSDDTDGSDGTDDSQDDGTGDSDGEETDSVDLSVDADEIRTGGSEERYVTASIHNPSDEARGYQLVADDDDPFTVTTQGASETELAPGTSEEFTLRVSPVEPGEGDLHVRAIADDGSEDTSDVPVTVEATEDHLRVGLSSSNLALDLGEERTIDAHVQNTGDWEETVHVSARTPSELDAAVAGDTTATLAPGEKAIFAIPVQAHEEGDSALEVEVEATDGSVLQSVALVEVTTGGQAVAGDEETSQENATGGDGVPAASQEDPNGVPLPALATLLALLAAARRTRV